MNYQLSGLPQLAAMRAGTEYRFEIRLRQFVMNCRPLTLSETNNVTSKVRAEMMKLPPEERTSVNESTYLAKAFLELSSTSAPGVYDPQLTHVLMDEMTADEIQYLYKQYVQVTARANPALEELDRAELDLLVEALKKSPKEALASQLIGLSFLQLLNVCRFLISRE